MPTFHENKNKTEQDAFHRVSLAKLGSLVGASDDYLLELSHQLLVWNAEIEEELSRRFTKADENEHEADLRRQADEDELSKLGDPRRCPKHGTVTSSPDGMFDTPCGQCEMEADYPNE